MQIVFLGTGGSWPSPNRNVAAIAIKRGGEIILLDCGEGTQRQFMMSTLSFMQISKILISHFHGDHFLGLPGLIQSMTLNDRTEQLKIYGPTGTAEAVKTLLNLGYFLPSFEVMVRDLVGGENLDFPEYLIKTIEVPHNVPTLAFSVDEKDRPGRFDLEKARQLGIPEGPLYRKLQEGKEVIIEGRRITSEMVLGPKRRGRRVVYSADTLPSPSLVEFAKGCDVLIHDATVDSSLEDKANKYGHSSARQAGRIAKECGAKILFLTHISPRYDDAKLIEEDAKLEFENSVVARDFLEYNISLED